MQRQDMLELAKRARECADRAVLEEAFWLRMARDDIASNLAPPKLTLVSRNAA